MITGDDLFYLLGVLNSNVFDFYNSLVSSGLSDKANVVSKSSLRISLYQKLRIQ